MSSPVNTLATKTDIETLKAYIKDTHKGFRNNLIKWIVGAFILQSCLIAGLLKYLF